MMFLQVTFSFHFSNFVLGSFCLSSMPARRGGDGCYKCDETVRALARRRGRNNLPNLFPSEVGVVGVELELYFVLQAIEHCMEHIGIFGKESGVYTYVIDHRLFERTI